MKNICKIIKKTQLCKEVFDFEVEFSHRPLPGQFIHVLCGDGVFLRRPISICDYNEGILRFSFAVRGEGTKRLANHNEGDMLDILGPLGRGFDTGKSGEGTAVVVGGGIGIFPLYFLSKRIKTEAILGFRTKDAVIMEDDFKSVCSAVHIATDDGSYGFHGLVTDVLQGRLEKADVTSVYACGPMPMMKEIKRITEDMGIFCQLSLEQRMGCGIGACSVCVCKSKGEYKKVCQNGPVFNAREVDFDE